MKKYSLLALILLLSIVIVFGCSSKKGVTDKSNDEDKVVEKNDETVKENNDEGSNEEESEAVATEDEGVPVYQEYSFAPTADLANIDDQTKDELQQILNSLGDPQKGTITFIGFDAVYNNDGSLTITTFVRNGFDYSVYNLEGQIKVQTMDGEIIASGNFTFPEGEFGILDASMSRPWSLTFLPDTIYNSQADLTEYIIQSNINYHY